MDAIESKPELYSITVYRYDYTTGLTSSCSYWRNPFHPDHKAWKETEAPPILREFFPSITRESAGYA